VLWPGSECGTPIEGLIGDPYRFGAIPRGVPFRSPPRKVSTQQTENIMTAPIEKQPKQLLHLVFGGELEDLDSVRFRDLEHLDIVGIYPNYAEAHKAWKAAAQRTVDNAHMRYFIVHMHRLLDPDATTA
jgi:hypothetical protein